VWKTLYFLVTWFGLNGGILLVQVYRYRQVSSAVERQQAKWVFFGGIAAVGEIIVIYVPLLLFPSLNQPGSLYPVITPFVTTVFLLLFALSIEFAILRYRLWDIDVIISRTLVYGILTTGIIVLYILVVGYLGSLFRPSNSLLISLVATGLVAVLFQPGRDWLQRSVNRLMYGQRDEPYRSHHTPRTTTGSHARSGCSLTGDCRNSGPGAQIAVCCHPPTPGGDEHNRRRVWDAWRPAHQTAVSLPGRADRRMRAGTTIARRGIL
jgi:hypothetical protein